MECSGLLEGHCSGKLPDFQTGNRAAVDSIPGYWRQRWTPGISTCGHQGPPLWTLLQYKYMFSVFRLFMLCIFWRHFKVLSYKKRSVTLSSKMLIRALGTLSKIRDEKGHARTIHSAGTLCPSQSIGKFPNSRCILGVSQRLLAEDCLIRVTLLE